MERTRGPMDKNRMRGAADRGERAHDREASVTKDQRRSEKSAEAGVAVERRRRAEREEELEAVGNGRVRPQMTGQLEFPFEGRGPILDAFLPERTCRC